MTATQEEKKNQTMTVSLNCLTLPHSNLHEYTGSMHEQNMGGDAARGPKRQWKKKEEEEEEEEGGVTVLILQPLDDDLRCGRGIELDPSTHDQEMKKYRLNDNPTERYNSLSSGT